MVRYKVKDSERHISKWIFNDFSVWFFEWVKVRYYHYYHAGWDGVRYHLSNYLTYPYGYAYINERRYKRYENRI
jgi:hypothetical protein